MKFHLSTDDHYLLANFNEYEKFLPKVVFTQIKDFVIAKYKATIKADLQFKLEKHLAAHKVKLTQRMLNELNELTVHRTNKIEKIAKLAALRNDYYENLKKYFQLPKLERPKLTFEEDYTNEIARILELDIAPPLADE